MKISIRFSDNVHILAFINIRQGIIPLTGNNIANTIETSPIVARRLMNALNKAGLVNTVHGAADPALVKSPENISLYDVFLAVEGDAHLFTIDERTNPQCIVGENIQETPDGFYQQAETAAKAKLARISLQDVIDTIRIKQALKDAEKERRN